MATYEPPDFPPPVVKQNVWLYMQEFPLKEIQKFSWVIPTYWATEKIPTSEWVGKAGTRSSHKSYPWHSTVPLGVNPNTHLLFEEERVWTTHLVPQLLRLPAEGWALTYVWKLKGLAFMSSTGQTKEQLFTSAWALAVTIPTSPRLAQRKPGYHRGSQAAQKKLG